MNSENNLNEIEAVDTSEENNVTEPEIKGKKLVSIQYDVKNEEEGQAFLLFQKKYVYKKNWIKTIAFAVAAILFVISIARSPEKPINYILATLCFAGIFIIWFNTKKIRTSLMDALKLIEDDKYIFTLYDDCFSIETILAEDVDENGEKIAPVEPRIVSFDDTFIDVTETESMFVLILKKDTIYVIPKRCMSDEQIGTLKNVLSEKTKENYEKLDN